MTKLKFVREGALDSWTSKEVVYGGACADMQLDRKRAGDRDPRPHPDLGVREVIRVGKTVIDGWELPVMTRWKTGKPSRE